LPAGELGRSSVFQEQPEPVLLELRVLLDGHNVDCRLRRHRLRHRTRSWLPGPLPARRTGESRFRIFATYQQRSHGSS
jgi:hypothetical protein